MSIKKFFGLLMVLTVAIFTFTACSSDDADEKVGTFEYAATCSSYEGSFDSMQKVDDAFLHAFGVTSTPITLTGTKSECNRKAKEYAMKAQAALANEGRFAADVEFVNVTTEEKIYAFSVMKNDNYPGSQGNKVPSSIEIEYHVLDHGIAIHRMRGNRVKIVKENLHNPEYTAFDGVIKYDNQFINLIEPGRELGRSCIGNYQAVIWKGTSTEKIATISFSFIPKNFK